MDYNKDNLTKRLDKIKNLYYKMDEILEGLPDAIPNKIKKTIKDTIFGDKELKELMEGLETHRAPRFIMVGRTGVGKSSLINAMCNKYLAEVSDVEIGTKEIQRFEYKDEGRTILEVLDTRGIGESVLSTVGDNNTAELTLINEMSDFNPDAILFLIRCKSRDRINEDIETLKLIKSKYNKKNGNDLPIIVVLNQADEMEPSQFKKPEDYTDRKKQNIEKAINQVKAIFYDNKINATDFIAASSLIDWGVSEEELKHMTQTERNLLEIEFDGRYNIDKLINSLENNLNLDARTGLLLAARLLQVVERLAKRMTHIFAGIAAAIAVTPIPIADIYILSVLQGILVVFIATLSGRDINLKSGIEFIFSLGGVGIGGFTFRTIAQQTSKLFNVIIPGTGSVISAAVASTGTEIIGNSATAYYIKEKNVKKKQGSVFKKIGQIKFINKNKNLE
jgi:predicted GTPase/uncharacterized protein (DUF697 family)